MQASCPASPPFLPRSSVSQRSRNFRRQGLALRTWALAEASPAIRRDYERLADAYEGLAREIESVDRILSCLAYLGSDPL